MTWWQWALTVWAIGVPAGGVANVAMLVGSGGLVTYWPGIIRNALLWPVMLPVVFGMYLESRG